MKRIFGVWMMAAALAAPMAMVSSVQAAEAADNSDAMAGATANADAAERPAGTEDRATAQAAPMVEDSAKTSTEATTQNKLTRTWEVQAEYLEGRFFHDRHIDDYNLHIYQKNREVKSLSIWYGLTLSRPVGYTTEDKIYRDSEAVGLGPSAMVRWERPIAGKLHGSIDGAGSLLVYNQAHPGDGRAFGFLWRIGPRLIYQATDKDAVNLGYLFHHSSNGFKHHNPGYNGVGFALGWTHSF